MSIRFKCVTVRHDGLLKREYYFVQLGDHAAEINVKLDRYIEYWRDVPRGRFKMRGKWQRIDRRDNTCEPPTSVSFLRDQILEEFNDRLVIWDNE